MNQDDLARILARPGYANTSDRVAAHPKPERHAKHEPMAAGEGKARDARSRVVRITSFRCKLLDPGANLWGSTKYVEDSLKYAGLLHDDSEEFIQITVHQEKVKTRKEERTEIIISQ